MYEQYDSQALYYDTNVSNTPENITIQMIGMYFSNIFNVDEKGKQCAVKNKEI